MDTIILQHFHFCAAHPQWKLMSWESRGMALELMAMAGNAEFHGTLAAEDDLWRNILNIPTQRSIQLAMRKSVQARGLREQNELGIVWEQVWKPELLQWFQPITQEFAQLHPQYSNCVGRYWHPLLDLIAPPNETKKSKKPRNSDAPNLAIRVASTRVNKPKKKVVHTEDPSWDYPTIRFSANVFKTCWDEPLTREARADLWNSAVNLLGSSGDPKSESIARQFIGKLIKEFGEKNTAAAVAQLVVRPIRPADPKSFLRKQLKNMVEGSQSVQKANMQRIKVPL